MYVSKNISWVAILIEYLYGATACITLLFLHYLCILFSSSPSCRVLLVLLSFLFSFPCQDSFKFADSFLTGMWIKPLYFVILTWKFCHFLRQWQNIDSVLYIKHIEEYVGHWRALLRFCSVGRSTWSSKYTKFYHKY